MLFRCFAAAFLMRCFIYAMLIMHATLTLRCRLLLMLPRHAAYYAFRDYADYAAAIFDAAAIFFRAASPAAIDILRFI